MKPALKTDQTPLGNRRPNEVGYETIAQLHFPKEDVLNLSFDKNQRVKDLQHANILGSVYKNKVSIVFEDIEGEKVVSTTVQKLTDTDVFLNTEVSIPVHRVVRIFY